nr:MAG TPA: hypothetical protein [Bacteriophage sp.]
MYDVYVKLHFRFFQIYITNMKIEHQSFINLINFKEF